MAKERIVLLDRDSIIDELYIFSVIQSLSPLFDVLGIMTHMRQKRAVAAKATALSNHMSV